MTDGIVVLKVVLEPPLIFERAEAEVAEDVMVPSIVDVIFEAIAILEYALAEVAVIFMVRPLLGMIQQRCLVGKFDRADTAPVLMRVVNLIAACRSRSRRARQGARSSRSSLFARKRRLVYVPNHQCFDSSCGGRLHWWDTPLLYLLPGN